MKLTVQQVWDATLTISAIIRDRRPMPLRGKFRLARMHAWLLPEFTIISERRDALIKDYHLWNGEAWAVPDNMMEHFAAAWKDIGAMDIEIQVEPISLGDLDLPGQNGAVEAHEMAALGDLIVE